MNTRFALCGGKKSDVIVAVDGEGGEAATIDKDSQGLVDGKEEPKGPPPLVINVQVRNRNFKSVDPLDSGFRTLKTGPLFLQKHFEQWVDGTLDSDRLCYYFIEALFKNEAVKHNIDTKKWHLHFPESLALPTRTVPWIPASSSSSFEEGGGGKTTRSTGSPNIKSSKKSGFTASSSSSSNSCGTGPDNLAELPGSSLSPSLKSRKKNVAVANNRSNENNILHTSSDSGNIIKNESGDGCDSIENETSGLSFADNTDYRAGLDSSHRKSKKTGTNLSSKDIRDVLGTEECIIIESFEYGKTGETLESYEGAANTNSSNKNRCNVGGLQSMKVSGLFRLNRSQKEINIENYACDISM